MVGNPALSDSVWKRLLVHSGRRAAPSFAGEHQISVDVPDAGLLLGVLVSTMGPRMDDTIKGVRRCRCDDRLRTQHIGGSAETSGKITEWSDQTTSDSRSTKSQRSTTGCGPRIRLTCLTFCSRCCLRSRRS